jgi:pimeloyl-ACP methyl ester carboxylesterase
VLDFIEKDPLRLHEVTARFLREDAGLGRRIAAIRELTVPTTLMLAEHDTIVDGPRTRAWFRATGGEHIDVFEGAGHLVILEQTEALAARVADSVRGGA